MKLLNKTIIFIVIFSVSCTSILNEFKKQIKLTRVKEDTVIILKTSHLFNEFIDKIKYESKGISFIDFKAGSNELDEIIEEIKKLPCKTIIAVDSPALNTLLKKIKDKNIVALNVLRLNNYKQKNLCGISVEIPLEQIIITYNFSVSASTNFFYFVNKNQKEKFNAINNRLKKSGYALRTSYISSPDDTIKKMNLIRSNDTVIMLPDLTVYNDRSFTSVLNHCIKNKNSFIGYNEYFVKLGCLFALAPDKDAEATQVAGIIYQLQNGKTPADIGIESSVGTKMIFNKKTADKINFNYIEILGIMDMIIK